MLQYKGILHKFSRLYRFFLRQRMAFRQYGIYGIIKQRRKLKLLRHGQRHESKVYLALIHPPAYFPMLTHIQLQFYSGILFRELRDYAWQQMYGQAEKAAYAYRSHVRTVYAVHLLLQLFLAVDYLAKEYHELLRLRGGRHAVFTPYQQREAELVFK